MVHSFQIGLHKAYSLLNEDRGRNKERKKIDLDALGLIANQ